MNTYAILDSILLMLLKIKLTQSEADFFNIGFKFNDICDKCKLDIDEGTQKVLESKLAVDGYVEYLNPDIKMILRISDAGVNFIQFEGGYRQQQIDLLEKRISDKEDKLFNKRTKIITIITSILSFLLGLILGLSNS